MIVKVSTLLSAGADQAWRLVKRTSTMLYVLRGCLGWADLVTLPDEWHAGLELRSRARPLHFLPGWRHEIRIVACDDDAREMKTMEHGGLLRAWNHTLHVEPEGPSRSRYTDTVDLDAGFLTPVAWLMAHVLFRYRQFRLRRLVRREVAAL